MSLFFIASGYLFKPNKIQGIKDLWKYFLRKVRTLWLPFVGFSTVFTLFNNVFLKLNFYTDNAAFLEEYIGDFPSLGSYISPSAMLKNIFKILSFQGNPQLGGALWFFQCLFYLTVGYAVIEFCLRKFIKAKNGRLVAHGILAACFLALGYYCHLHGISGRGLNRFFSYYCLYYLGSAMKEHCVVEFLQQKKDRIVVLTALISLGVLIIMQQIGWAISIVENSYTNPLVLLIASMVGWIMMVSIATLLKRVDLIGNRAITYISIHSIPIIGLHFLSFKLVNWIAVMVYGMNYYMIAAFPVLMHGAWWVAYLIVGISVPLLVDWVYICLKNLTLVKIRYRQQS